jgi:hypothetical protein
MKRQEVYKIIDGERFYQDSKWEDLDKINNVSDFMIYMQNYLNKAMVANNPVQNRESLDNLRKVVSIGIGCFEKFGVPERQ